MPVILPNRPLKTRAIIVNAMCNVKQRATETGELTNIDNYFVFCGIFGTNSLHPDYYSSRTNFQDEILDI